ncbi:MAG: hypothetical protein LBR97_01970 [Dysgonamonadaceae bacterium]|jgi:hypothetical protein|nr:hypothetical protein [Dysgonamonadaceae bacterium]
MKCFHFIKIIFSGIISLLLFSCNNDFLYEKSLLTDGTALGQSSSIVVSPGWDAADYPVICPDAGNANFRITQKPDWLIVGSPEGKFTNGTALINCSAEEVNDFSIVGIYCDFMTIEDENGKKYPLQVAYINEGNPRIETSPEIYISVNYQSELKISNTGDGILIWQVMECPKWLQLNSSISNFPNIQSDNGMPAGMVSQGSFSLYMSLDFSGNIPEKLNGQIVIASNDKTNPLKTIPVAVDLGNPLISFYLYNQTLDFGKTGTSIDLEFSNQNNGILLWEFTGLPEWLTCSQTSGALINYNWKTVTFIADRSRVPAGTSFTTIYLNSNDANNPKIPITVKIRNNTGNPAGIVDVDGNITDAWLDKPNGKLYYTTVQPNKLVAFDMVSKTVTRSLDLKKAPSCFSISDNGQEMAIGQAGQFSIVDLNSFTLTKELEAYYQINDIAWATDDVVVYTPQTGQWENLCWTDITTSKTTSIYGAYGGSIIKKIPGYNYMLYTDLSLSPGGISVYNIQTKEEQYYTHESIGNFWFSQNGKYLFCRDFPIYRVSDLVSRNDISPIATFQTPDYFYPIWIDDNTAANSVWFLQSSGNINQYEANDFTYVKSLNYTDFYIKNGTEYDVEGKYLFANQAGTELVVMRKAINDNAVWSLEFIPVQ